MSRRLHFLGWHEPVASLATQFLIPGQDSGFVDLCSTLIVVPTRQAGRRLRKQMALHCRRQNAALLSTKVVTPAFFFAVSGGRPEANLAVVKTVWAQLLLKVDIGRYAHLFPSRPDEMDFAWALSMGEMIQAMRETLADGALRMGDVPKLAADGLDEPERWEELARLDAAYMAEIERRGLADPCDRKIRAADSPQSPAGVARIVIAAVPDPSPLMLRAMEKLEAAIEVVVLVAAPEDMRDAFDEWGRPRPTAWRNEEIAIPDAGKNIILAADPRQQSRAVMAEIARSAESYGPADIAVGVPDRAIVPYLEEDLAENGLDSYDPAERSLREHRVVALVEKWGRLINDRNYQSLALFLRHPDVLEWISMALTHITPGSLLKELDEFQNLHLPATIDDLYRHFAADHRGGDAPARKFGKLGPALREIKAWTSIGPEDTVAGAIRRFLRLIYGNRSLKADNPRDDLFAEVAGALDGAIHEIDDLYAMDGRRISHADAMEVFLRRLQEMRYTPPRKETGIDLEGWLELHWNDALFIIVTGMNETCVPDGRMGDAFLPDALRSKLRLRDDATRLARDAFIMRSLLEIRRSAGRVVFIAGKSSATGDPLKPSRLLFRCPDGELSHRAEALFGPAAASGAVHPFELSFQLNPLPEEELCREAPAQLPVTAFKDYIDCPFRFYLKHVLKMEELDDTKREPDALDFGVLAHRVLQEMASDHAMRKECDEKRLADFLEERVGVWIAERYGETASLPVTVMRQTAVERLKYAARAHIEALRDGWELVAQEHACSMTLGGIAIRGRIDRIDRHRESGALRVIDYKTSDTAREPRSAHLKRARPGTPECLKVTDGGEELQWIDLQLPLYSLLLAAEGRYAGALQLCYFNLPKTAANARIDVWEDFGDNLLNSARACAEELSRRIAARQFWPPAEKDRETDVFRQLYYGVMRDAFTAPDFNPAAKGKR